MVEDGLNVVDQDISKATKVRQETEIWFICREMYESSQGASYLTKIDSSDRYEVACHC